MREAAVGQGRLSRAGCYFERAHHILILSKARMGELTKEMPKGSAKPGSRKELGSAPKRDALAAEGVSRKEAADRRRIRKDLGLRGGLGLADVAGRLLIDLVAATDFAGFYLSNLGRCDHLGANGSDSRPAAPNMRSDLPVAAACAVRVPQRAMVGAHAADLFEAEAKERQRASQNNNAGKAVSANLREQVRAKSTEQAAAVANVSARSVESARKVLKEAAPELAEAVTRAPGALSKLDSDWGISPVRRSLERFTSAIGATAARIEGGATELSRARRAPRPL